ncbi:MAG: glutamine amidotransferase [Betaproteobacteria bacterium]|nr:glutamine amidotransferase [Betaproteobacteria bacterium]
MPASAPRRATAIGHVAFEDCGSLAAALAARGIALETVDACTTGLQRMDPFEPDLLVVLGGPVGIGDCALYPFIDAEIDLLRARLQRRLPTLGICLGAQFMAAALGARVYPGGHGKEIGWGPIEPGVDVGRHPAMASLFAPEIRVLHWHGDTFELPRGADHLASSPLYVNQAFALESYALALQFHVEVRARDLPRWYVGHCAELAAANVDVTALRHDGARFAPILEAGAFQFWNAWLDGAMPLARNETLDDDARALPSAAQLD